MRHENLKIPTMVRRFERYSDQRLKTKAERLADHDAAMAEFFARGREVEVIPGFSEVAPRPPRKVLPPKVAPQVLPPPPDDKFWRPAPDWPGYTVSQDGQVKGVRSGKIVKPRPNGKVRMYNRNAWEDVCPKALAKLAWGE